MIGTHRYMAKVVNSGQCVYLCQCFKTTSWTIPRSQYMICTVYCLQYILKYLWMRNRAPCVQKWMFTHIQTHISRLFILLTF